MAWPGTLTEAEQASLLAWLQDVLRPWCGEQARVNNHGEVANTEYNAVQLALLAELDGADVIPVGDGGGLSGAEPLTKNEVVSIVSHVQNILSSFNTGAHRQLWAKAAGETNLIG